MKYCKFCGKKKKVCMNKSHMEPAITSLKKDARKYSAMFGKRLR